MALGCDLKSVLVFGSIETIYFKVYRIVGCEYYSISKSSSVNHFISPRNLKLADASNEQVTFFTTEILTWSYNMKRRNLNFVHLSICRKDDLLDEQTFSKHLTDS